MARYIVDANVLINWLLSRSRAAEAFFEQLTFQDELIVPPVLLPECTSVLREETSAGRLLHEEAADYLHTALSLPMSVYESTEQFPRALDLAAQFQHQKAYDMQYVAVAELSSSILVTADRGAIHAASQVGVAVEAIR